MRLSARDRGRAPIFRGSDMYFSLRKGTTFCIAGDQIVCLDIVGDRYFTVDAKAGAIMRELLHHPDGGKPDGMGDLVRLGIASDDLARLWTGFAELPRYSLLDTPQTGSHPAGIFKTICNLGWTALQLRMCALGKLLLSVCRYRDRASSTWSTSEEVVRKVARAYQASEFIVAARGRCLNRSIAMTRQLLRAGQDVRLVFGVMMRPFRAHCWVQWRDVVLNDTLDHVRNFSPILVV